MFKSPIMLSKFALSLRCKLTKLRISSTIADLVRGFPSRVSFAWAEMLICTAMLFRRFDFELCGVKRERDVDVKRDCFLSQPSRESKGIRTKIYLRTD